MKILTFDTWLTESTRPLRKLSDLGINRNFKGERYEYELFPRFRRLQSRLAQLDKKPALEEWFNMMQQGDAEFYTLVQTDVLGQPDVRELWRDLTGQRSSRMKRFNLAESAENLATWKSELDPAWTVIAVWPQDSIYEQCADLFEQFGIAFADLRSMTIFMDGAKIEEDELSPQHLLAIEAHEIAHYQLGHKAESVNSNYNERQEREADWFAIRFLLETGRIKSAELLEDRYNEYYGESSADLLHTADARTILHKYLKK